MTATSASGPSRAQASLAWLLLVPIVALAATRELWAPDEPRYAEIARELWTGRSFLVLRLCGELYPDKPPLVYWLVALAGGLSGWSELALRLPSILATAGTAWLCAHLARRFWGAREAAWAVAFYLGTVMVTWLGGRLALDPALSFLCLASLVLATEPVRGARRAVLHLALAGACLGLAALAKGPVAWLHVGCALAAWRFVPKAMRLSLARPQRGWLLFALLAVAPVLVWATSASIAEPRLWRPLFFGQHLGRIGESKAAHHGPFWYHFVDQSALLLPWTFLFVAGLCGAWKSVRAHVRGGVASDLASAACVRLAAWFALVFLVFSAIPPKRELYLLPIYPAAALLCARTFAQVQGSGRLSGWIAWPSALFPAVAGAMLVAAAPIVRGLAAHDPAAIEILDDVEAVGAWPVIAGLSAIAGALVALVAWRRGAIGAFAVAIFAGLATTETVIALAVAPRANAYSSARELAHAIAARPEKPSIIPCWGVQPEGYRFYAGVPTVRGRLFEARASEGTQFLGLINPRSLATLAPEERALFRVIEQDLARSREAILIGAATSQE